METEARQRGDIVADRYRIVAPLGEGGMGTVYRVEHVHMAKEMAMKLLRPELSTVPEIAERFEREARSAARLDDRHIVRVTDFGKTPTGELFLIMELLDGEPLSRVIETRAPLAVDLAVDIVDQILAGLEHAHAKDVIHRDLKPDNVMLVREGDRAVAKILDFGLAKISADTPETGRTLTRAGMVFGTPRYMSPEQATAEHVDARTDLYAVGVLFFELLTGRPPFSGATAVDVLKAHLTAPVPTLVLPFVEAGRTVALDGILHTALAKNRDDRFANATAFRQALAGLRSGATPIDPTEVRIRPELAARPMAQRSTKRWTGILATAALAVASAATFLALVQGVRSTPEELVDEALHRGDIAAARETANEILAADPESARGHLLLAQIDSRAGNMESARAGYERAIRAERSIGSNPALLAYLRDILASERERDHGIELLTTVARNADDSVVPFLAELAKTSGSRQVRRLAIEGLDDRKTLDRIDALPILLDDLAKSDSKRKYCDTRKWYVERIVRFEDPRVLPALERELERKGFIFDFGLGNACMEDLLRSNIARLRKKK